MAKEGQTLVDTLREQRNSFLTRRGGEKPVAPIAPLMGQDTATPLQDIRDKTPTQPAKKFLR